MIKVINFTIKVLLTLVCFPISGAFVPTCLSFIKEDLQDLDKRGRKGYDKMVSEY